MRRAIENIKKNSTPLLLMAIVIALCTAYIAAHYGKTEQPQYSASLPDTIAETDTAGVMLTREDTLFAMVTAFAMQESRCNPKAVSECGRHVGYLQISEICVREANRILGEDLYTNDDRYDEGCSYGIFKTVQEYHNPTLDIDKAITVWNKNCPQSYRDKVKNNYYSIINQ